MISFLEFTNQNNNPQELVSEGLFDSWTTKKKEGKTGFFSMLAKFGSMFSFATNDDPIMKKIKELDAKEEENIRKQEEELKRAEDDAEIAKLEAQAALKQNQYNLKMQRKVNAWKQATRQMQERRDFYKSGKQKGILSSTQMTAALSELENSFKDLSPHQRTSAEKAKSALQVLAINEDGTVRSPKVVAALCGGPNPDLTKLSDEEKTQYETLSKDETIKSAVNQYKEGMQACGKNITELTPDDYSNAISTVATTSAQYDGADAKLEEAREQREALNGTIEEVNGYLTKVKEHKEKKAEYDEWTEEDGEWQEGGKLANNLKEMKDWSEGEPDESQFPKFEELTGNNGILNSNISGDLFDKTTDDEGHTSTKLNERKLKELLDKEDSDDDDENLKKLRKLYKLGIISSKDIVTATNSGSIPEVLKRDDATGKLSEAAKSKIAEKAKAAKNNLESQKAIHDNNKPEDPGEEPKPTDTEAAAFKSLEKRGIIQARLVEEGKPLETGKPPIKELATQLDNDISDAQKIVDEKNAQQTSLKTIRENAVATMKGDIEKDKDKETEKKIEEEVSNLDDGEFIENGKVCCLDENGKVVEKEKMDQKEYNLVRKKGLLALDKSTLEAKLKPKDDEKVTREIVNGTPKYYKGDKEVSADEYKNYRVKVKQYNTTMQNREALIDKVVSDTKNIDRVKDEDDKALAQWVDSKKDGELEWDKDDEEVDGQDDELEELKSKLEEIKGLSNESDKKEQLKKLGLPENTDLENIDDSNTLKDLLKQSKENDRDDDDSTDSNDKDDNGKESSGKPKEPKRLIKKVRGKRKGTFKYKITKAETKDSIGEYTNKQDYLSNVKSWNKYRRRVAKWNKNNPNNKITISESLAKYLINSINENHHSKYTKLKKFLLG